MAAERGIQVAVVGATGAVGEAMLSILAQRQFPCANVVALASERSLGKSVAFGKRNLAVQRLDEFDFAAIDLAFFSAGGAVSAAHAPRAAQAGAVVIDNTSCFRYQDDVPLVVPEVNPEAIDALPGGRIIANPNCSTIQMLVALAPLHRRFGLRRINVATYQAVSGSGRAGIEELATQTRSLLNFQSLKTRVFPAQIAFNTIPQVDEFQDNGYTREEMKMVWETHKILGDDSIGVNPTAVRVPVFYGHGEALHVELKQAVQLDAIKAVLQAAPGVAVMDGSSERSFPTPVVDGAGSDAVYVGRIRADISCENGLNLWVVADNVRKGAALNAVQIGELLLQRRLIGVG